MLGQLLSSNGIDVKINKYNILSKVRTIVLVVRSSGCGGVLSFSFGIIL